MKFSNVDDELDRWLIKSIFPNGIINKP
jgi:hypothetical protein